MKVSTKAKKASTILLNIILIPFDLLKCYKQNNQHYQQEHIGIQTVEIIFMYGFKKKLRTILKVINIYFFNKKIKNVNKFKPKHKPINIC